MFSVVIGIGMLFVMCVSPDSPLRTANIDRLPLVTHLFLFACRCSVTLPLLRRFTRHDQHPQDVTGAWLLPPIANIVCSASGAIVAGFLDERRATITVIIS